MRLHFVFMLFLTFCIVCIYCTLRRDVYKRQALIGIDVHSQGIAGADAHYHVAEYQRAAVAVDLDGYNILILAAEGLGVGGGHVNVTLGGDDALFQHHFTLGANQLAGTAAFQIAAFTDGGLYADAARVGQAQLHLGFLAAGAQVELSLTDARSIGVKAPRCL